MRNTFGSPIHDGRVPAARKEVDTVHVDGRPVDFVDGTIPSKLHRALIAGRSIQKGKAVFDCRVFAALMYGIDVGEPNEQGRFNLGKDSIKEAVDVTDSEIATPLNLGRYLGGLVSLGLQEQYVHTVSLAHTLDEDRYLHKLGDEGPICLSIAP